jgi:hypothetical protein
MNNAGIILLTLSVLSTLFFAFLYWTERTENKALRKTMLHLNPFNRKMQVVPQQPGDDFLAGEANRLENENAALRSDVETGCRTIEAQIKTINQLRGLLNASQQRNKTQKSRK